MKENKPQNCWDCKYSEIIGTEAYFGNHKCSLEKTGNVEKYANRVYPQCPKGFGTKDHSSEEIFNFFNNLVLDWKETRNDFIKPDRIYFTAKQNDMKITISIEEEEK